MDNSVNFSWNHSTKNKIMYQYFMILEHQSANRNFALCKATSTNSKQFSVTTGQPAVRKL